MTVRPGARTIGDMKNTTVTTTTQPTDTAVTSAWSRRAAWAAPPALAVVVLLHRNDPVDPMDLSGSTATWIWIHVALLGALVLLAHAVSTLLTGVDGIAARVARALLPVALVAYAAFDALVGLGTGVLVERAQTLGPDAAQLVEHWWSVPTPISTVAAVAQLLWVTVLGATAVARVTRDAPRFLVPTLAALTATFPFIHVRPVGLIPVALLATALWLHSHPSDSGNGVRHLHPIDRVAATDPAACVHLSAKWRS
jgi:hypothetical protein